MIYDGAGNWIQNQEFVASRNPNYWQKDKPTARQLPYLDKITFKPNPDAEPRLQPAPGRPARRHAHARAAS